MNSNDGAYIIDAKIDVGVVLGYEIGTPYTGLMLFAAHKNALIWHNIY